MIDENGDFYYDEGMPRSYDAVQIEDHFQLLGEGDPRTPHFHFIDTDNADAVFVFRHDDDDPETSNWPHLLRIRYRLHDSRGLVTSTMVGTDGYSFGESGRWFEHIIRVPRP